MYHSLASILADGSVYIGGSNPNNLIVNDGPYPTEFRTQRFIPDYLQTGAQQNTIQVKEIVVAALLQCNDLLLVRPPQPMVTGLYPYSDPQLFFP